MEEKLKEIVKKIELSKLSNDDKEALYQQISVSLHSVVVPVLLKYIPKEQLDALTNKEPKDTVDGFVTMLKTAMKDGKAFGEIAALTDEVLADVETALVKGGVV